MTPKEKAKYLTASFFQVIPQQTEINTVNIPDVGSLKIDNWVNKEDCKKYAKDFALIAVNEILEISKCYAGRDYEYYTEVKKEIELL